MADDMQPMNEKSMESKPASKGGYGSGYGKRPLWQWILLYLVIGGIIYWAIYYFYFMPKNGSGNPYGTTTTNTSIYGNQ